MITQFSLNMPSIKPYAFSWLFFDVALNSKRCPLRKDKLLAKTYSHNKKPRLFGGGALNLG
jgi:hypothetical protein